MLTDIRKNPDNKLSGYIRIINYPFNYPSTRQLILLMYFLIARLDSVCCVRWARRRLDLEEIRSTVILMCRLFRRWRCNNVIRSNKTAWSNNTPHNISLFQRWVIATNTCQLNARLSGNFRSRIVFQTLVPITMLWNPEHSDWYLNYGVSACICSVNMQLSSGL